MVRVFDLYSHLDRPGMFIHHVTDKIHLAIESF